MCGICGAVDYNKNSYVKEDLLRRMCSELRHRGPDDEGIFINNKNNQDVSIGLGHRRLSIIDLSFSGHQPMSNENGTIWIVFNGEIYNYKELRDELEKRGHKFKSHTDTETIIHLYEEYGQACVKYLRGMFAFAVWDETNRILMLARDRVGKKPLLYYHKDNAFYFASEFCSILASNGINKEINLDALEYYLSFGYIPAPLTIYKNIFKLLPAHVLILRDNKCILNRYWELDYSHKLDISAQDAAEEILRLLKEAVKIRLYSDVPLGAFLSGGIDSSTIVGLMSRLSDRRVDTFSIGFQESDYSELEYARNIARRFDTRHHEFIVKPRALEILPLLVERYGEPYADSSCIPTYYVALQTKQHVTVALNGDGADELFAGYERYQAMLASEIYQNMPKPIKDVLGYLASGLPDSPDPRNQLRRLKRFFVEINLPAQKRYLRWVSIFNSELRKQIYSQDFRNRAAKKSASDLLEPYINNSNGLHILDSLLMADTNTYLPYDLLVKVDITSMSNSLEARSPFLDHKLMEFVAKLPAKYKMRIFIKKYILKKVIKGLIPPKNIYRRKMGFGMPVGEWFRCEVKGFLTDTILSNRFLGRGYFNPVVIRDIVKQHCEKEADYTFQLWALLMLELWHQRFVD